MAKVAGGATAYRLLLAAGEEAARRIKGQLRVANSAGEQLNPEVIRWFEEHVGCSIYDQYGQTELGMVVCNYHTVQSVRHPGSMGRPLPGFRVALLDEQFREVDPGLTGQLAVDRTHSPLYWFGGYWQQETTSCYAGPYYLTGDTAENSGDGTLTFVGRADDVITSAGYRIGPFEVESCLIEHPAGAQAAVVRKPDPGPTQLAWAFVVLRPGYEPTPAVPSELEQFVKQRLSAHAYPREIARVDALPKT